MLGSANSFGLPSSSSFGSPSVSGSSSLISFGQSMFGNSNHFGSNVTSSTFGTSTGVFGSPCWNSNSNSHPFGSQISTGSTFGTSSVVSEQPSGSRASGSLTPPTPVFGYMMEQQPTAGALGSNSNQLNPFGSSNAFDSSVAFGAPHQYAFGAVSSSGLGQSTTPAFGTASSSPAPFVFGQSSTPAFGATSSSPASFVFGQSSTPAFGTASSSSASFVFGPSNTPAFGTALNSPALFGFGQSSAPAFGTASSPPALFGSGRPSTPASGTQMATHGYYQVGLVRSQGTRGTPYAPVQEGSENYMSISLMSPYMDKKSHEELRWEDYQRGDKGGGGNFHPTGSADQQGSGALPFAAVAAAQQQYQDLISISLMPAYIFNKSHEELRWEDYERGNRGRIEFGRVGFGHLGARNQQGSRIIPYAAVQEDFEKHISISFMPPYKHRSHEELRWEDYQRGDKGSIQFGQTRSDLQRGDKRSIEFGQTSSDYQRHEFGQASSDHQRHDKGVQTQADDRECVICLTNLKNMAFNCGHQTCCECGPKLQTCPICRGKIYFRLKLY